MIGSGPRLRPYHWWGDAWAKPNRRTLQELVALRMIDPENADTLATHVESGGSVIVGSNKSGSGKSTVANALFESIPESRTQIFVRGNHEMFDWIEEFDPASLALLVNEMSEHLPVYAWRNSARQILDLTCAGAQLITTMHVDSSQNLAALITNPPISASPSTICSLGLLVLLDESRTLEAGVAPITTIIDLRRYTPNALPD